jgi:branched-subunit amino acid transport protein
MSEWLVIVGAGLVTFLARASFIVFADPHRFPHAFRVALAFVPAAVLAAIVVPGLAMPHGALDVSTGNPRLLAGLAAIAAALKARNPLVSIVAGMAALWGLQALAG